MERKEATAKPEAASPLQTLKLFETATLQGHGLRELLGLFEFLCHFFFLQGSELHRTLTSKLLANAL